MPPTPALSPLLLRSPPAVAIVVSRYNASITDSLLEGACACYTRAAAAEHDGGPADRPYPQLQVVEAPGAFELPALALGAARTGRFDGIVALGCLIKGETSHDRYIAHAIANGLVQVTMETGIPVALGVLTVDTVQQARDRAGGVHGNKGDEAMAAVLHTIASLRLLQGPPEPAPGPAAARPAFSVRDKGRDDGARQQGGTR